MTNRTFTDEEAAQIAGAYFEKRVKELSKSLEDLQAQELAKAIVPTHGSHQGSSASGGTEDIAAGKIDPPGKNDALKTEALCKKCGSSHALDKTCKSELGKAILKDSKGEQVDNGVHPDSSLPGDKAPKKVNNPGKSSKEAGAGGAIKPGKALGKAATPPTAKPPSGQNMGTAVPTSAPKAPAPKIAMPKPPAPKAAPGIPAMKEEKEADKEESSVAKSELAKANPQTMNMRGPAGLKNAMTNDKSAGPAKPAPTAALAPTHISGTAPAAGDWKSPAAQALSNKTFGARPGGPAPIATSAPSPSPAPQGRGGNQVVLGRTGEGGKSFEAPRSTVIQQAQRGVFNPDPNEVKSHGLELARQPGANRGPQTMLPSATAKPAVKPGIFGRLASKVMGKAEMEVAKGADMVGAPDSTSSGAGVMMAEANDVRADIKATKEKTAQLQDKFKAVGASAKEIKGVVKNPQS